MSTSQAAVRNAWLNKDYKMKQDKQKASNRALTYRIEKHNELNTKKIETFSGTGHRLGSDKEAKDLARAIEVSLESPNKAEDSSEDVMAIIQAIANSSLPKKEQLSQITEIINQLQNSL